MMTTMTYPSENIGRGFLVAPMNRGSETVDGTSPGGSLVHVKLAANPLENNERPIHIAVGFDDDDVYLQTIDGLPLVTIRKARRR